MVNRDKRRMMRRRSQFVLMEENMEVYTCVDGAMIPDATMVGRGMSFEVHLWISAGEVRRECVGPVQVNSGDANGGDSAVSGPGGPI